MDLGTAVAEEVSTMRVRAAIEASLVGVRNQHNCDALIPESSGGWRVFGEPSKGSVVGWSALDRPGLPLLPAL